MVKLMAINCSLNFSIMKTQFLYSVGWHNILLLKLVIYSEVGLLFIANFCKFVLKSTLEPN